MVLDSPFLASLRAVETSRVGGRRPGVQVGWMSGPRRAPSRSGAALLWTRALRPGDLDARIVKGGAAAGVGEGVGCERVRADARETEREGDDAGGSAIADPSERLERSFCALDPHAVAVGDPPCPRVRRVDLEAKAALAREAGPTCECSS